MDPLSITAGAIGILAFAGSTISTGYALAQSLKTDHRELLERLLAQLTQLTGIIVAIQPQESNAPASLTSSLKDC